MIGCNSRESYQGAVYDIQTQDLREQNLLESRIYREGKILATIRSGYSADESIPVLQQRMSEQHEEICAKVREGSYALIFLWKSRGGIAYESGDYLKALEYFESVLSIDESQEEVQAYLDKIREVYDKDPKKKREMISYYQGQIESLTRSGRSLEASRKEAILSRLVPPKGSPAPTDSAFNERARGLLRAASKVRLKEVRISRHAIVPAACAVLILCAGVIFTDAQIKLDPVFHSHLGQRYLEKNQILLARNIFYNLLCQDPTSEAAFVRFWETFRMKGDYQVATEILQEFLQGAFPPARTRFYLAEAFRMQSRCSEAFVLYEQAMEESWPEGPCKIGMGLCLLDQNDPPAAIQLWEAAMENGSKDFRLDYGLGMAYQASDRPGRASFYFMKALKKNPSPAIYRSLAACLQGMHQDEKAQNLLETAEALEGSHGEENPCPAVLRELASHDIRRAHTSPSTCFPFRLL